jgi:hypothetical protein
MSGVTATTFSWRKDGAAIGGAPNAATYTIPSAAAGDAGTYTVLVNNCFLSAGGVLTVNSTPPPSDINGDCARNGADVTLFVQVLLGIDNDPTHVSRSDLDSSGTADGADIQPFVTAFLAP